MCGLEKVWLLSNQIPSETKGWDMLVLGGAPVSAEVMVESERDGE